MSSGAQEADIEPVWQDFNSGVCWHLTSSFIRPIRQSLCVIWKGIPN